MEQDRNFRPASSRSAPDVKATSLVDCLLEMPVTKKSDRVSETERAAGARLEARLSAEIRTVITARLRSDDVA